MSCPFCAPDSDKIAWQDETLYILRDGFPVTSGHLLIVPKRHVADWFSASADEQQAVMRAIEVAKRLIEDEHAPDGYNVGFNAGEAAGQTVFHLHLHVIPRYAGDVEDPRGGVRHVIPAKGNYLKGNGK